MSKEHKTEEKDLAQVTEAEKADARAQLRAAEQRILDLDRTMMRFILKTGGFTEADLLRMLRGQIFGPNPCSLTHGEPEDLEDPEGKWTYPKQRLFNREVGQLDVNPSDP